MAFIPPPGCPVPRLRLGGKAGREWGIKPAPKARSANAHRHCVCTIMSLAFRSGQARAVRRPGKEMRALHASAVWLPGPGARWVHSCGRWTLGEGRQRQNSVALDKKIKFKRVVWQNLTSSIQHPLTSHLRGAVLCSRRWRQPGPPWRARGKRSVLDPEKPAWEPGWETVPAGTGPNGAGQGERASC